MIAFAHGNVLGGEAPLDLVQRRLARRQGQVDVERLLLGLELGGDVGVGELEEGQGSSVANREEGVGERNLPSGKVGRLALLDPRRHERQSDDVLVEVPGALLVGADIGIVVKPRRQLAQDAALGGHMRLAGHACFLLTGAVQL